MKNHCREFCTFTKKERIGIIVLLSMIALCTALPWFFSGKLPADRQSIAVFDSLLVVWKHFIPDTGSRKTDHRYTDSPSADKSVPTGQAGSLFIFDPNSLATEGWMKLGLPVRIIQTIHHYINKGGRFRKPEDLARIYGLKKEWYEKLVPYVRISSVDSGQYKRAELVGSDHEAKNKRGGSDHTRPRDLAVININTCDTVELIALPGIGSRLAQRIIKFREALGGFFSVEQISEVFGLPDSVFQLIRPRLVCPEFAVKKLHVNTADVNTLRQHPYIKWSVANAVVRYREQHGPFRVAEDLRQIALITPEMFNKIVIYLSVE